MDMVIDNRATQNKIKIVFDGQLFLKGNKTGIAWGADNVIREIAKDEAFDCSLNYLTKGCPEDKIEGMKEYEKEGIKLHAVDSVSSRFFIFLWGVFHYPYSRIFKTEAQIYQFFNFVVPIGIKGKKVTMVHDMSYLAYPGSVRLRTKMWLHLFLKGSLKRADCIITVSEFTKKELVRYLQVPSEKIRVMYQGVDLSFYRPDHSPEEIEKVKAKYGIRGEYLFYIGTIEPRKNLQRLIEAYGLLLDGCEKEGQKSIESVPDLILAGGEGWLCEDIYKAAGKPSVRGKVKFLGYIDKEDTPLLMCGARCFCFPSIYEGFGMPPVEAMACGTPVLASKEASLPEILSDKAVYVDAFSVEDISEKLKQVVLDDELLKKMKQGCREYAMRYDWKNSANTLKTVYRELYE